MDEMARERWLALTLAGVLMASIVSVSFHNLDRLGVVTPPTERLVEELEELPGLLILADSAVSLAALEEKRQQVPNLSPQPLASWPPHAPVLGYEVNHRMMLFYGMELQMDEERWTLWWPRNYTPLPHFGVARVDLLDQDGEVKRRCLRDAEGAVRCGEASWMRMGPRTMTVDRVRETCIWAHPLEDQVVRFRFPDVVLGAPDGRNLVLETALRDAAVGGGAAVKFRLRHGDVVREHHHRDRRGWQYLELPHGEVSDVLHVEVKAARTGRRHVCFRFGLR